MAESLWEPEVAVETQGEEQAQAVQEAPSALAVSADDFAALEERVKRAVELVKQEREARAAAEALLRAQSPVVEQLQSEVNGLRAERDQVRQRVERLLKQLDALEL